MNEYGLNEYWINGLGLCSNGLDKHGIAYDSRHCVLLSCASES